MPHTHAQLQGVQHPGALRDLTCATAKYTSSGNHRTCVRAHQLQGTMCKARALRVRASTQLCCWRASGPHRQRCTSSAARMIDAEAPALLDTQPDWMCDVEELVHLAEELAVAAGSITKKYFR